MNAVYQQDLLAPGSPIGENFIVRERLGGGGMGDVYLAEHASLPDIKRAVKVLRRELSSNPRFVALLHEEARKQSRLTHDNVVQIYDFFPWNGHYCLIQAYVPGRPLSALIAQAPQGLPLQRVLDLICEVLAGLDYAHREGGVLHCDVKPANIVVDETGRARITDFGISRDVGARADDKNVMVAGTPGYMSPEQGQPPYHVDHRTDVYSTGVLLFEMLCGRLPFAAALEAGVSASLQAPPDIRQFRKDIPEAVARILFTAMQFDREQRFAGCADFRNAIEAYRARGRRRKALVPLVALACVATAATGYAVLKPTRVEKRLVLPVKELVQDGATALSQMCREVKERDAKRPGVELASRMEDEKLKQDFSRRIAEMDANIEGYSRRYLKDVSQLQALPAAEVSAIVGSGVGDADAWAVQRVISDLAAARKGQWRSSAALVTYCR